MLCTSDLKTNNQRATALNARQPLRQILALRPLRVRLTEMFVQRMEAPDAAEMAPRVVVIRAEDPLDVAMRGLR